jgi:hypothetical protein
MDTALTALRGTVVANMPDCTLLLASMLTEEVLAAVVGRVIGTGDPIDWKRLLGLGELLAFPASCRASFGAAGPFHVANLCTADLTGFCRTSHASRMFAVGKRAGDDNGAVYLVKPCGHIAGNSVRRAKAGTSQPTKVRYLYYVHTVIAPREVAIDSRHKVANIQGDMDDLEDRLSDNVHGNATQHGRLHDTRDRYGMFSVRDARSWPNSPSRGNYARSQGACCKVEGILLMLD